MDVAIATLAVRDTGTPPCEDAMNCAPTQCPPRRGAWHAPAWLIAAAQWLYVWQLTHESPSLADKIARSTATHMVDEIAAEIAAVIHERSKV